MKRKPIRTKINFNSVKHFFHQQVRQPLRVLVLRPEDDRQDQVLRGRPQARLQEVLRQVKQQTSFYRNIGKNTRKT